MISQLILALRYSNVHIHVRVLSLILVLYLTYIPYKANAMPYKECMSSIKLVLKIKPHMNMNIIVQRRPESRFCENSGCYFDCKANF